MNRYHLDRTKNTSVNPVNRQQQIKPVPVAPPVYRPSPLPKVLQKKSSSISRPNASQTVPAFRAVSSSQLLPAQLTKNRVAPRASNFPAPPPTRRHDRHPVIQRAQQQLQLQIPRQAAEVTVRFTSEPYATKSPDGSKWIVSSGNFQCSARIDRDALPNGVNPDDNFGWLQTIFASRNSAYYNVDPARAPKPPLNRELWEHQGTFRGERIPLLKVMLFSNESVPYQARHDRLPNLPASDRGEQHPIFYDHPANFAHDPQKALLMGHRYDNSRLGAAMDDKPQDVFPLRTPDDNGYISNVVGKFDASCWLVAMRGPAVIHYFYHCDWEVDFNVDFSRSGVAACHTRQRVTAQGPGQGQRQPVIGGTAANNIQWVTEWSRPLHDPFGIT